jgi:NAD(P)-dependent dehydrogenase (short-subunit alcohol dehydrogenase family)
MSPLLSLPPLPGTVMLPADTFKNDVVLITCAETLLARATALEFARAGARVALATEQLGIQLDTSPLDALGAKTIRIACQPDDPASVASGFDAVERHLGPVTILVNSQVAGNPAPAERLEIGAWRKIAHRIIDSAFVCSSEFARRRVQSRGGVILHVVDTMGWGGGPGMAHVATATAGVINLTKTLAVEWAPDDIRVNAIAPGPFAGEEGVLRELAARTGQDLAVSLPALRLGQPQEFGWAATFLCSDYSAYTTGAVFTIDGGNSLRRSITGPPFIPTREWAYRPD